MTWAWIIAGWLAVSIILAPFFGRWLARIAAHYPEVSK